MTRSSRHADLQAWFAGRSDADLQALVDAAPVVGRGVGGVHRVIEVLDVPVFVKQVPLTQLELDHPRSTANLFEFPPEMHWGVRSVGMGAWRELAANLEATALFTDARCLSVPLLHDWRVLGPMPGGRTVTTDGFSVDEMVDYWDGAPSVGRRMEAVASAPASITMFLEHVPETVASWYARQCAADDATFAAAFRFLLFELTRAVGDLVTNGIRHHDAHLENGLTDGSSVLLSDLGLAACLTFDLDDAERAFLATTELHDIAYVLAKLVNMTVHDRLDLPDVADRYALVRDLAVGGSVPDALRPVEEPLVGLAGGVAVFNAWFWDLFDGLWQTPYPSREIQAAFEEGRFG